MREVSQKQKRDFFLTNSLKDNKKPYRYFSLASLPQNDKIGVADDKSIKDCDEKVAESKNDRQITKATTIEIFRLRLSMTKMLRQTQTRIA